MIDRNRPELPRDESVPAVETLLGSEASEVLGAVLMEAGGRVRTARPTQVRYVPGRSVTVQYRADVEWQTGNRPSVETLVATTGTLIPDHLPLVDVHGSNVGVWRYPHDPFLPGLAPASDSSRVLDVLAILGAPVDEVRLRRRAYRPGRRAVIEVVAPTVRIFLKVVRPDKVSGLQSRHVELAQHVPIPHSFGWSGEFGLVAMQAMPGKTLRKTLESGGRRLPDPGQLVSLLDGLISADAPETLVAGPVRRAPDFSALIGRVLPHLVERLERIVEAVTDVSDEPSVPVHGDFHSSQILTKASTLVGLIDVDTVGKGSRADDLATLLAHVSTLGLTSPSKKTVDRYGRSLVSVFDQLTSPADLRLRTAAAVLGFATGPFRVQQARWPAETERRVALAERWMEAASTA